MLDIAIHVSLTASPGDQDHHWYSFSNLFAAGPYGRRRFYFYSVYYTWAIPSKIVFISESGSAATNQQVLVS